MHTVTINIIVDLAEVLQLEMELQLVMELQMLQQLWRIMSITINFVLLEKN